MYILTSKIAFRHSGAQFWRIKCLKSGPKLTCFVHFYFKMYVSPQRRAFFRHLNFKKCSEPQVFCTFSLANVFRATAACNFSTSELPKVLRTPGVLYIFTCKCLSRYSGVQFFDIGTSKSAPNPRCFVHFHLQMSFALQRRAIFRQLNFKKCSETVSFSAFSLQNALFTTAACDF